MTFHRSVMAGLLLLVLVLGGCATHDDLHDKPISPADRSPIQLSDDLEPYPIDDPLMATVVGTPDKLQATLPSTDDVNLQMRTLDPTVDRDVPPSLRFAQPLKYLLAPQDRPAPMAFVIAGTGASANAGKCVMLSQTLHQMGYSVACMPSPTTTDFMLNAADHPVPGRMKTDAQSLYKLMQAIRDDVSDDLDITDYSLAGYSLGGSEAAYVTKLDDEQKEFNFKHVLLLNPAVNLVKSVGRMDDLLEEGLPGGYDDLPQFLARVMGTIQKVQQESDSGELSLGDDGLYEVYKAGHFDDDEVAALIGVAFRLSLADMAYSSDVLTDSGVIVPEGHEVGAYDSMDEYFEKAFRLSFDDYIDKLLVPYWNRDDRNASKQQLIEEADMHNIADFLANDKRIGMFTNADDPILDDDEVDFLRETFGDRARISPHGGHMGNLSYQKTVQAIQEFFAR